MKKQLLLLSGLLAGAAAYAQPPALYNTISGTVWRDNGNGVRDAGEELIGGVLVTMLDASNDAVISSAVSNASGVFVLNNYIGNGTYYLNYAFPSAGYTVVAARAGGNNALNSAADENTVGNIDPNVVSTPNFTINANTNLNTYGLGLVRIGNTRTYWATQPSTPTDWNVNFRFPKSDNGVGTINRVTIFATDAVFHPTMGIENTGASGTSATLEGNGRLTLTPPTGTTLVTNTLTSKSQALAAYDGTTDYDNASGHTWYDSYASAFSTRLITNGTQLNSYRTSAAPDSISVLGETTSATTIIGSGNLLANVATLVGSGVFVTYTYTTPLPVSLSSFSAVKSGDAAQLQWVIAEGKRNQGYAIERSIDGIAFSQIGYVAANAQEQSTTYTYKDLTPKNGRNLYRLRLIDNNGDVAYSATAAVTFGQAAAMNVYPNPASTSARVMVGSEGSVSLYNQFGQAVPVEMTRTGTDAVLHTAQLPSGIYILQIIEGGITRTERLLIQQP